MTSSIQYLYSIWAKDGELNHTIRTSERNQVDTNYILNTLYVENSEEYIDLSRESEIISELMHQV